MPARSQAQRAYLYSHFGADWVKAHHFDTKGPLPERVGPKKGKAVEKGERPAPGAVMIGKKTIGGYGKPAGRAKMTAKAKSKGRKGGGKKAKHGNDGFGGCKFC